MTQAQAMQLVASFYLSSQLTSGKLFPKIPLKAETLQVKGMFVFTESSRSALTPNVETSVSLFEREKDAFFKKKDILLNDPAYIGKYVAMVDGEIAGTSSNEAELAQSIYKDYGYRPIYIGRIESDDESIDVPSVDIS